MFNLFQSVSLTAYNILEIIVILRNWPHAREYEMQNRKQSLGHDDKSCS